MGLLVDDFLEVLPCTECGLSELRNVDLFVGLGVTSNAGLSVLDFEGSEAGKVNLVAGVQGLHDALDGGLQYLFRIFLCKIGLFCNL
jgi:hypothetical protein